MDKEKVEKDNQIMENGWQQMLVTLDDEMPVKKKKRRFIWLVFILSGLLLSAYGIKTYSKQKTQNKTPSVVEIASNNQEAKQSNDRVNKKNMEQPTLNKASNLISSTQSRNENKSSKIDETDKVIKSMESDPIYGMNETSVTRSRFRSELNQEIESSTFEAFNDDQKQKKSFQHLSLDTLNTKEMVPIFFEKHVFLNEPYIANRLETKVVYQDNSIWNPYLGLVGSLSLSGDHLGYGLSGGLDVDINDKLFVHTNLKYQRMQSQRDVNPAFNLNMMDDANEIAGVDIETDPYVMSYSISDLSKKSFTTLATTIGLGYNLSNRVDIWVGYSWRHMITDPDASKIDSLGQLLSQMDYTKNIFHPSMGVRFAFKKNLSGSLSYEHGKSSFYTPKSNASQTNNNKFLHLGLAYNF